MFINPLILNDYSGNEPLCRVFYAWHQSPTNTGQFVSQRSIYGTFKIGSEVGYGTVHI